MTFQPRPEPTRNLQVLQLGSCTHSRGGAVASTKVLVSRGRGPRGMTASEQGDILQHTRSVRTMETPVPGDGG